MVTINPEKIADRIRTYIKNNVGEVPEDIEMAITLLEEAANQPKMESMAIAIAPGDMLVITVPGRLSAGEKWNAATDIARILPGVTPIFLENGVTLSRILKKSDSSGGEGDA